MRCKVKQTPRVTRQQLEDTLYSIAVRGQGLKLEVIDWSAVGRFAVIEARMVLAGKCGGCGRSLEFRPRPKTS